MGLSDLDGVHMPPYIHTPPTFEHPLMFRVLIGYLFCYIIKCFPTLEAVMGGCKT